MISDDALSSAIHDTRQKFSLHLLFSSYHVMYSCPISLFAITSALLLKLSLLIILSRTSYIHWTNLRVLFNLRRNPLSLEKLMLFRRKSGSFYHRRGILSLPVQSGSIATKADLGAFYLRRNEYCFLKVSCFFCIFFY